MKHKTSKMKTIFFVLVFYFCGIRFPGTICRIESKEAYSEFCQEVFDSVLNGSLKYALCWIHKLKGHETSQRGIKTQYNKGNTMTSIILIVTSLPKFLCRI